jgi:hypothetical protein
MGVCSTHDLLSIAILFQLDKEEESEAPILKEDQDRINEFARLHTLKTELLQQRAQLEVRPHNSCWSTRVFYSSSIHRSSLPLGKTKPHNCRRSGIV